MNSDNSNYEKAKKRVKELKDFYRHVKIFVIINGLFYLLKSEILLPYIPEEFWLEPYFFNWVDINVLIWGVILAIHALYLNRNKFPFLKKWEEKQIKKYMDMEQEENHKRYK
ncbi:MULTISPECIES: 2TM domain-containing protein [Flavobacteriaceae]|uniref:2TM domain-containing protein n=1 Tax=Flavobacteriaceae TaxID=49546 RepID=UPI00149168CD|nr:MULTISPECIES: 2TM domain-containing protein [Allomuricauda]MDC6365107.1 2TM domain-containing protein [Muricauda sp. AC10]